MRALSPRVLYANVQERKGDKEEKKKEKEGTREGGRKDKERKGKQA